VLIPEKCPGCQAELSRENLTSELKEWGEIRQRGIVPFIMWRGVLPFSVFGIAVLVNDWHQGRAWTFGIIVAAWTVLGGLFFGWLFWSKAEKQYQAARESEITGPRR